MGALRNMMLLTALGAAACADRRRDDHGAVRPPAVSASNARPASKPEPPAVRREPRGPLEVPSALAAEEARAPADGKSLPRAMVRDETDAGPFIVDELVDVAPAGPASATAQGIVMVDKQDQALVARRGALARGPRPATSPIATLERRRAEFAPYGKGPAVIAGRAYWVSRGRLVRRRLDGTGELEILAKDARTGTRVAGALAPGGPVFVAYVTAADEQGTPHSKLWIEGGKSIELTPEGSGTSSIALAAQKNAWMLVSLDGRSGMTPLHARRLTVVGNDVNVGPDIVAWVGASAQSTTEVMALSRGDDVWAFVAIEIDALHFGLAQIHLGRLPQMDAPATFLPFANGTNTTPVAAAGLCGRMALVYARPANGAPGAPQELLLSEVGPEGLLPGQIVARSKAFADASMATVEGGGIFAYTADHRTWAASVRCR